MSADEDAEATTMNAVERREFEIQYLERLYALSGDGEDKNMQNESNEINQLAAETLDELEMNVKRAGTIGAHCYFCGRIEVPTKSCGCSHPEAFACSGKQVCRECRAGMRAVAAHVDEMFTKPYVCRVNSTRARLARQLSFALERTSGGAKLFDLLRSHADVWEDSPAQFRFHVLRAFERSRFLAFARLAEALKRERDEFVIRRIALIAAR